MIRHLFTCILLVASASLLEAQTPRFQEAKEGLTDQERLFAQASMGEAELSAGLWRMGASRAWRGELLAFAAERDGDRIVVSWITRTEYDSQRFMLERRQADGTFAVCAVLPAAGRSDAPGHYRWEDWQPLEGDNIYRLRQVSGGGIVLQSPERRAGFSDDPFRPEGPVMTSRDK